MSVNGTPHLDPLTTATPAEYVALLRQVREQSGLAYRAIERKAASAGDSLPPSTLATMLNRTTLPREELVVALLRATGHDEQTIDQWVRARRALVSTTEPAPAESPSPEDVTSRRRPLSPKILAAVVAVFVVIAGALVVIRLLSGPEGLPTGVVRIRSVHSGLCVDELPDADSGDLLQVSCANTYVERTLVKHDDNTYRIVTMHPVYLKGCMGAAGGKPEPGNPVVDDFCHQLGESVKFELVPTTEPLTGYRLRFVESGLCAEVLGASVRERAAVQQAPCDAASKGQVFAFDAA